MATSRNTVTKFFEDYFFTQLNQPFDENVKIADIDGFDSLAIVDLSIEFENSFNATLELETIKKAIYLRDVVDIAVALLE